MCTFKQAFRFLMGRLCGKEYGILYKNGEQSIVPSEQLRKLNILLTENFGQEGKLSAPQVNSIIEKTKTIGRKTKPFLASELKPYKYYNYPYRKGALIFNDDSKLVFGITPKVKLPSFYNCLSMI